MKFRILLLSCCFIVVTASNCLATELDDGFLSLGAGNYDTAIKILTPFAERGNTKAQRGLGLGYKKLGTAQGDKAYSVMGFGFSFWHQRENTRKQPNSLIVWQYYYR